MPQIFFLFFFFFTTALDDFMSSEHGY